MKWSPQAAVSPPDQFQDKRADHRYRAEGEVSFFFEDPLRREVTGKLMDYSRGGFRVVHNYPALVSGQVVSFRHILAGGEARVVWNRIMEGLTETGFVVLTASPQK